MFLVNSRSHLVSAAPSSSAREELHLLGAHLLPKLRCHFAEFLHPSCLIRLRILTSSTCVGLGYGLHNLKLRGFSWKLGISYFISLETRHRVSALAFRICLEDQPTCLNRDNHHPANLTFFVTPSQLCEVREY